MSGPAPSGHRDRPAAETGTDPSPMGWCVTYAGVGLFVGLMLSSLAAGLWLEVTGEKGLSLGGLALSQVGLWVGLAGAAVWASRTQGSGSLAVDFGLTMRPIDAVVGPIVGVVAQVGLVSLVYFLLSPLVGHPDVSQEATDLVRKAHGIGLVGLTVFVVIGAPVVEELFFRGLLLRGLRRRMPDAVAIALSSALFGLAHFQEADAGGLVLVVSLFALGAVLAVMAVRSDRLGLAIWAHVAFNAFTVIVLLVT